MASDETGSGTSANRKVGRRVVTLGAMLAGAASVGRRMEVFAEEGAPHWTYEGEEGPEFWGDLAPDFATCTVGKEQSPIDLIDAVKGDEPDMTIAQQITAGGTLVNNGHTLQVNLPEGNTLAIGDAVYELVQFHFHTPSEHEVDGVRYPIDLHLVHKTEDGKLAVLGVLMKEGEENAALAEVFTDIPEAGAERLLANPIDIPALVPSDQTAYRYPGSLTTPPCAEGVTWTVFEMPMTLSPAQLQAFRAIYPLNARPVQPLNEREVEEA